MKHLLQSDGVKEFVSPEIFSVIQAGRHSQLWTSLWFSPLAREPQLNIGRQRNQSHLELLDFLRGAKFQPWRPSLPAVIGTAHDITGRWSVTGGGAWQRFCAVILPLYLFAGFELRSELGHLGLLHVDASAEEGKGGSWLHLR